MEQPRLKRREVVKIYTAVEVAAELKVDYKTVLRLVKRGFLKALPGIRHKRITEEELNRYLGIKSFLASAGSGPAAISHSGSGQSGVQPLGHSARSSGVDGAIKGQIVVNRNGEGRGVPCRVVKPKGNK
jgi:excisionase family DNA binding protein